MFHERVVLFAACACTAHAESGVIGPTFVNYTRPSIGLDEVAAQAVSPNLRVSSVCSDSSTMTAPCL